MCGQGHGARRGTPARRTPTAPGRGRRARPRSATRLVAPSAPITTSARIDAAAVELDGHGPCRRRRRGRRHRDAPVTSRAPASTAASASTGVEPQARDGHAVAGVVDARRSTAGGARPPVGPTTTMSPSRAPCPGRGPGRARPAAATPRGPTASPHALSRGKAALSTSATRAPPRARTRAVDAAGGARSHHRRVEVLAVTTRPLPTSTGRSCGIVAPCARETLTTGARNSRFARRLFTGLPSATTGWRSAVVRPERPLAPGHGGPHRGGTSRSSCSTWPRAPAGVALQLAHAHRRACGGGGPHRGHDAPGPGQRGARRACAEQVQVVLGSRRATPLRRRHLRRRSPSPISLRYVEDPAATLRELARVVRPGGDGGQPRVPRARPAGSGASGGGATPGCVLPVGGRHHGRPGVVPGGTVPRAQHLGPLPPLSR